MSALTLNQVSSLLIEHINNTSLHSGGGTSSGGSSEPSADVSEMLSQWKKISKLLAETVLAEDIYASYVEADKLTATNAFFTYVQAADAVVNHINAEVVDVKSLYADCIKTDEFEAAIANINQLLASYIRATDIVADNVTVGQLFATSAKFFTMIADSVTSESVATFNITSDHMTIADAYIKNAMIDSITADKITAGLINTAKVSIQSEDGALIIADSTITIKDDTNVRVQIGKDANGDYNMYVMDASGNVMWNALGLTADAIKSGIIRDDMVSDTANINGSKLDIASIVTKINEGTTQVNSTKINMDSDGQTLSVWFQTMVDWKGNVSNTLDTQQTTITLMQGQLQALMEDTRIDTLTENYQELETKTSQLTQTVNGMSSDVSATKSSVETLSASVSELDGTVEEQTTRLTEVSNKTTQLTQTVNGFDTRINAAESRVTSMATTVDQNAEDIVTLQETATTLDNKITATAGEIRADMSANYSTKTETSAQIESAQAQYSATAEALDLAYRATNTEWQASVDEDYVHTAEFSQYIRFSAQGIELGQENNPLILRLKNDSIVFENAGVEVGYWDGSYFHTGNMKIDVNQRAQFGNFAWIPRTNGSLALVKVE